MAYRLEADWTGDNVLANVEQAARCYGAGCYVAAGFRIMKELLKTIYQHDSLIRELAELKKSPSGEPAPALEAVADLEAGN